MTNRNNHIPTTRFQILKFLKKNQSQKFDHANFSTISHSSITHQTTQTKIESANLWPTDGTCPVPRSPPRHPCSLRVTDPGTFLPYPSCDLYSSYKDLTQTFRHSVQRLNFGTSYTTHIFGWNVCFFLFFRFMWLPCWFVIRIICVSRIQFSNVNVNV